MSASANLALPFIEGGELLPDVALNETLRLIDTLVQLAILDRDLNAPPGSPLEGQRWIVKASPSPTGAWAGHGNHVAAWQDGGWVFCAPKIGWFAFVIDEGALVAWSGTAWVDALAVLATLQNLSLLGVGTTADAANPFSAKLNNALWVAKTVAEGGDGNLRYKMSKESAAKTLSLLFQDNFSGRAEVGLTGDDDLHFKVSADGSSWLDAITIDKTTGKLTANQGFTSPATTRGQLYAAPFDALAHNGLQLNGGMEISQENDTNSVSLAASGSFTGTHLVDGVRAYTQGTFVAAAQQVTDAPPGYSNSLKFTVSTAQSSLGAFDTLHVSIPIEGHRATRVAFGGANAQPVSGGFWVKAHQAGTYSGVLRNSAKDRCYPFAFTINAADTWEFKTFSVAAGDTGGTWLTGTGVGLDLVICIASGASRLGTPGAWSASTLFGASGSTNGVAATTDTFHVTGVIVLPGLELPSSSRAPFILRPFDQELVLAQRYFETTYGVGVLPGTATSSGCQGGVAATTGAILACFPFKVQKRVVPSMTLYGESGTSGVFSAVGGGNTAAASAVGTSTAGFFQVSTSGLTAGAVYYGHWKADARL